MFKASRLSIARKRRGWTKNHLADKAGISVRSVSLYENGNRLPTDETAKSLSDALEFPYEFFFADDIEEPSADSASFRALASMTASQRDMALASGAIAIQLSAWIDERFSLPQARVPNVRGFDPESAADALRSQWGLGAKSIGNMVHLLEAHGVRVFSIPSDSDSVNAFSLWHRGLPFVFLTTDKSGERGRFDAAHELAHLVMHQHGGPRSREAEHEADRFASAFLMPRSSVVAHSIPRAPTIEWLVSMKRKWKVSLSALVQRLWGLRLISEWYYRSLCIEISRLGYRRSEPEGIQRESSQVLAKVFASLRSDGVAKGTIATDLRIKRSDLDALIFGLVTIAIPGGGGTDDRRGGRAEEARKLRLV